MFGLEACYTGIYILMYIVEKHSFIQSRYLFNGLLRTDGGSKISWPAYLAPPCIVLIKS